MTATREGLTAAQFGYSQYRDFAPVALTRSRRFLLVSVAWAWVHGQGPLMIDPKEIRAAQDLEAMGLIYLEAGLVVALYGERVPEAVITPAGLRCIFGPVVIEGDRMSWFGRP